MRESPPKQQASLPHRRGSEGPYTWDSDWIHRLETQEHWRQYWQQQAMMQDRVRSGDHVLEIGVGSGFTANYLRTKGVRVTTLDIDEDKEPDIVANVAKYAFPDQYDHVLAFEVFEHMPYDALLHALPGIARATGGFLFLSVPECRTPRFQAEYNIPFLGKGRIYLATRRRRILTRNHHWELGYDGYTEARFVGDIEAAGFKRVAREKPRSLAYFVFEKERWA